MGVVCSGVMLTGLLWMGLLWTGEACSGELCTRDVCIRELCPGEWYTKELCPGEWYTKELCVGELLGVLQGVVECGTELSCWVKWRYGKLAKSLGVIGFVLSYKITQTLIPKK
ncbi:hypothetical protein Bca4012_018433 [Brassica carinata]